MSPSPSRILCAVDFSECSRRALEHAIGLARCYGSAVTVLHVVPPPAALPATPPAEYIPGIQLEPVDLEAISAHVREMADDLLAPGVSVDVVVTEAPDVANEILVQAKIRQADLIVLGTHGRGPVGRLFLGSVAEQAVRQSVVPVVTASAQAPEAMPLGPAPFSRIVCGIDFSPDSERALQTAIALARESRGTLVVVHAIEIVPLYFDFAPPTAIDVEGWRREAAAKLRALIPDDVRAACDVREIVVRDKAYQAILDLAASVKADLIVVGTHGRGVIDRFFFGSTANHVVRQAKCAVMTVRSEPYAQPRSQGDRRLEQQHAQVRDAGAQPT